MSYNSVLIKYLIKEYNIDNYKYVSKELSRIGGNPITLTSIHKMVKWMESKYTRIHIDQSLRAKSRAQEIEKMVSSITDRKITSYYDLGCGSGTITEAIGKIYGLPKNKIYGIDTFPASSTDITSLRPDESITIEKHSVDLITAFVSLHHIQPLEPVLEELSRVASKGCIFIIREHDCTRKDTANFLNLYHSLMMMIGIGELSEAGIDLNNWNDAKQKLISYMSSIKYKSLKQWKELIEVYGFEFLDANKYEGNNPQELFYAAFIKL